MNSRNLIIGVVVVIAVAIVAFFLLRSPATAPVEDTIIGTPSPEEIPGEDEDVEILPEEEIVELPDIVLEVE